MLDSLKMAQHLTSLLRGIVLVSGVIVVSAPVLSGKELSHPPLVDPAITKCTVCHTTVGATHPEGVLGQNCLSCHTLVKRSKKTFLIVEDSRQSTDMVAMQVPVETGVGETERRESAAPVPPNTRSARSDPPPVETVAKVAVVRPTASAPPLPPTGSPERQEPAIVSGDADDTRHLYAEGMAAFNRANFDSAFHSWWLMLNERPDHFVLQVEMDTYLVSAQSTLARYGEHSLYVVKKDDRYWVLSGLFATRAKAIEALRLLPEPLRQGGAFPIAVRQIMPQQ
jgi:hypothetical protein